jgi:hypothetical protein
MLKTRGSSRRGIRELPLDVIVGSVERCSDFTRSYLPFKDSDQARWTSVCLADPALLPPIETYQIGKVHFVADGHHRVSVARQRGMTHIRSSVAETQTRVPLSPDVQPHELAIKAEYAGFLDRSQLDRVRPGADLSVTNAGQVRALEKQIEAQRAPAQHDEGHALAFQQAAVRWYDEVYSSVAQVIREREILRSFPGRTETDLFLWLCEHTESLRVATGWPVDTESAADDLVARYLETSGGVVTQARHRVLDLVLPEELQAGPQPGRWRREREITNVDECLFGRILVPISGAEGEWWAVAQAAEIACRERHSSWASTWYLRGPSRKARAP